MVAVVLAGAGRASAAILSLAEVQRVSGFTLPTLRTAQGIAISAGDGGLSLYATSTSRDAVNGFFRDPVTGMLSFVNALVSSDLNEARPVVLGPGDGVGYVGAREAVVVFVVLPPGSLTTLLTAPVPDLAIHGLAVGPGASQLYAVGQGTGASPDGIRVLVPDPMGPTLTTIQSIDEDTPGVDGLRGAVAVALSPDATQVLVAGTTSASGNPPAVVVFSRDPMTGLLTFDTVVPAASTADATSIAITPDGTQVLLGDESSTGLFVFDRDPMTGSITPAGLAPPFTTPTVASAWLRGVDAIAVSPDGTRVYAASQRNDVVVLLDRDPGTGAITFVSGEEAENPVSVALSPEGGYVYAGSRNNELRAFRHRSTTCSPAPLAGCRHPVVPLHSSVRVIDQSNPNTDKLEWEWTQGAATSLADFGDPITTQNDMFACLYDAGGAPQPLQVVALHAGGTCNGSPCWRTSGTTRLKYLDVDRRPDGAQKLDAQAGAAGQANFQLTAKGRLLRVPTLPLTPPVTMQLQSIAGVCWEAVFPTPVTNSPTSFRARGD